MASNSRPTQVDRVYDYMKRYGSINTWQAFNELGVARLSARVWELRNQGIIIKRDTTKIMNRYGETITAFKYILEQRNEQ